MVSASGAGSPGLRHWSRHENIMPTCGQAEVQSVFSQAGCQFVIVHQQQGRCVQTDVVEDAAEADTLDDHLDAMFAPDAPPLAWDAAAEYTRRRLELYYLAHAADPLGEDALAEVGAVWPPQGVCRALAHGHAARGGMLSNNCAHERQCRCSQRAGDP